MTITYHKDVYQGSEEWHGLRCGMITASTMNLILTPTLEMASNEKERSHLYELVAQRVTNYVEPQYISDDMLRGHEDEIEARDLYSRHIAPVQECGYVTNDKWGFKIGYSPDGLVNTKSKGLVEFKSRRQKFQMQTLLTCVPGGVIPTEFLLQVQTGLLVTEREWCDFGSFCGGLPLAPIRVFPDEKVLAAIESAAINFETAISDRVKQYRALTRKNRKFRLIKTERKERGGEII